MAQSDFEAGLAGVETGSGDTKEIDFVTMMTQLDAAIGVRIAAANNASPCNKKLQALRLRVAQMRAEVGASGAGLVVKRTLP
jgi:hypothetical protein